MKKYSFPPIADKDCAILILGTMPGERSLQEQQYYANPMNQFWRILSEVTKENYSVSYDQKRILLIKNKIAIWDVLMHCEREGSLDSNIKLEFPNDFKTFFSKQKNIKAVFFNGAKAEKLFRKFQLNEPVREYATLPSTSSANTRMTLNEKTSVWKNNIGKYL